MTTRIIELFQQSRSLLYDMYSSSYLDGQCYEFAVALHQGLGWQMIGIMHDDTVRHSVVHQPNGLYRDIRGEVSLEGLGLPFGLQPPYALKVISIEDLRRIRPVTDESIALAMHFAQNFWPELPWKKKAIDPYKEFADKLEALSRETGIWIRSAVPGSAPVLSKGDEIEAGYELKQTDDGLGVTIDRYFY